MIRSLFFLALVTILSLASEQVGCSSVCAEDRKPVPLEIIISHLKRLEPLQKVHYSWPVPFKEFNDGLLYEYVRLTHAATLGGDWATEEDVKRAMEVCRKVNSNNPAKRASIGISFSPWHRKFGEDRSPTETGRIEKDELDYLFTRMAYLRRLIADENARQSHEVTISCLIFDTEVFDVNEDDDEHNDAITRKCNLVYDMFRKFEPDAKIVWYARGAIHPNSSPNGWGQSPYLTLDEKGDCFSCSLYRVPEIETTRETFRQTVANAAKHGCDEVTPYIALGSGYRRKPDAFQEWSFDWNYDLIYSYQLGSEVNQRWFSKEEYYGRFGPWDKAKVAIFYPEPFGRTPHWGEHFVAYVMGANLTKTLPRF